MGLPAPLPSPYQAIVERYEGSSDPPGATGDPWNVFEVPARLLVEGGPTLWRAFLLAGLVDEIYCYRAERGAAGDAADAARGDIESMRPAHAFELAEIRQFGSDGLYVFHRK